MNFNGVLLILITDDYITSDKQFSTSKLRKHLGYKIYVAKNFKII